MKRFSTDDVFFSVNKDDWYGDAIFDSFPSIGYLDWDDDYPVQFSSTTIRVSLDEMLERILRDTAPRAA